MIKWLENARLKQEERKAVKESIQMLLEDTTVDARFLLLASLAGLMASLGFMMNNATVLIGAMLIAPLLTPVISLSIGVGAVSFKLIFRSFKALTIGIFITFMSALTLAALVRPDAFDPSIWKQFEHAQLYSLVAFISGIISVYSGFKPNMNKVVPGVAIAVALVPPISLLAVVTMLRQQRVIIDLLQVIGINLVGLFLGGLLAYIFITGFSQRAVKTIDKQVEEEVENKEKE